MSAKRIVVVGDENPDCRLFLEKLADTEDHVILASNVWHGAKALRAKVPADIIVVNLGNEEAFEFAYTLRQSRQCSRSTLVFVISNISELVIREIRLAGSPVLSLTG